MDSGERVSNPPEGYRPSRKVREGRSREYQSHLKGSS